MKNREKGFSTAFALTILFSLCVIILSFAINVTANEKKINSYKMVVNARKEVDSIALNIEERLQDLTDYLSDTDEWHVFTLISGVGNYDITVKDVSTGINKNFISPEVLNDEIIRHYILSNEETAFTEYGWINSKFSDKEKIDEILIAYENKNPFPLINNLPPLNIHFMTDEFIKAIFQYFKIKNPEQKLEHLREKLIEETTVKDLAEILEISESHAIFDLIGLKTLFWNIKFETEKYICNIVFGAVPQKDNQKKIDSYIIVEKNVIYKGGTL